MLGDIISLVSRDKILVVHMWVLHNLYFGCEWSVTIQTQLRIDLYTFDYP